MENEELLIKKAKKGDTNAFKELILPYQTRIYNLALYFSNNEHDASDLSQETWLKVFSELRKFRFECGFYTWVCKILKNTFIDRYSRKSYRGQEVPISEIAAYTEKKNPLNEMEQKQRDQIIRDAVAGLPEEFRITVVLIDMEGQSYEEVSRITRASVGTVRSRLSRARNKLRNIFINTGTF